MKHFLIHMAKLIIHKLHKKTCVEDNNCKIIQLNRFTFTKLNLFDSVSVRHYISTRVRLGRNLAAIVCGEEASKSAGCMQV